MEHLRKRNRDELDADEIEAVADVNEPFRKKVIIAICAVMFTVILMVSIQAKDPALPIFESSPIIDPSVMFQNDEFDDETFLPAKLFQQDIWARIIAIDEFCVDPTRKSEQQFWDIYRGRESDWYKEYRMSQVGHISEASRKKISNFLKYFRTFKFYPCFFTNSFFYAQLYFLNYRNKSCEKSS
jgi:hypothetical protein